MANPGTNAPQLLNDYKTPLSFFIVTINDPNNPIHRRDYIVQAIGLQDAITQMNQMQFSFDGISLPNVISTTQANNVDIKNAEKQLGVQLSNL